MRGGIDGLPSRYPLAGFLPSLMQADDMTSRWVAGLDEVLAPVLWTLDSLDSYFDPRVAPTDFVDWLGTWVGSVPDESVPAEQRRELVAWTATLHGMRGTIAGLAQLLELACDAEIVSLDDGRSVTWSQDPSAPINGPGSRPLLRIEVRGDDEAVDRVRELAAAWCPAHVPVEVEVVDG